MGMPRQAFFPVKQAEFVTLAATRNAVPLARRLVGEVARHWHLPQSFTEDAELVISELTTNALKATEYFNETCGRKDIGQIKLRLRWTLPSLYMEVWDINPLLPVRRSANDEDTNGRGLGIVEFVCADWSAFHCAEGGSTSGPNRGFKADARLRRPGDRRGHLAGRRMALQVGRPSAVAWPVNALRRGCKWMRPGNRDRRNSAAIERLSSLGDDRLLTPREVAEMFGVRTATIAVWARQGRLPFTPTPGAHRRYRLGDVLALLNGDQPVADESDVQTVEDAVRLYDQGWSIEQVAEKFNMSYSAMRRRLLRDGVRFRRRGGTEKSVRR